MRKSFRLRESELRNMIAESVKRVLREGNPDRDVYDKWEEVRSSVGDDTFISAIYDYMSGDDIEDFLQWMIDQYDLDYDGEY